MAGQVPQTAAVDYQPHCIYVPDISDLLYLIFTGMYTFKASSKELQNCACLCMHHWLDLHVCLSGQRPKPGSIKDHVTCNDLSSWGLYARTSTTVIKVYQQKSVFSFPFGKL